MLCKQYKSCFSVPPTQGCMQGTLDGWFTFALPNKDYEDKIGAEEDNDIQCNKESEEM